MSKALEYIRVSLQDPRTEIISLIMILLFVYYMSKLLQILRCRHSIRRIRKWGELLEGLLKEYQLGICIEDGNSKKTNELAENFFNSSSLIVACRINRQAMSAAAGMLVGIGVLGTFLGLSYSVTGFDTASSEAIMKSIDRLLPGMGTAFFTSVMGMVLS